MEDLLQSEGLNGSSWHLSFNAGAVLLAFVAAVVSWYFWSEEVRPAVVRADIPGRVTQYAWRDVAEDRPAGFPWALRGCKSFQDVAKHVWRLDDELCDDPLAGAELEQAFEEIMKRLEGISFLEAHPPIPGDFADAGPFDSHWLCVYKFVDGTNMFGGAPYLRVEPDDAAVLPDFETLHRRKGRGPRAMVRRLLNPEPATPELLRLTPPVIRGVYEIHDGMGTLLNFEHAPTVVATPMRNVAGSGYYVYPLRSCRPIPGYNGLVPIGRIDAKCTACVVRSTNAIAYVESSGATPEVVEETPLEYVEDTLLCLAGSLVNQLY